MDNDNKIKQLVTQVKKIFLKEFKEQASEKKIYNLDEEFAKTKRNQSIFVWIVVFLFIAVFTVSAIVVTKYIQLKSSKVSIDIKEFNDIKLKDILDKVKKYESDMRIVKLGLEDIITKRNAEIAALHEKANQDVNYLSNKQFSQEEVSKKVKVIRRNEKRAVAKVIAKYKDKIKKDKAEIAVIQKKIDEYDSRQLARARKQEEVLNNQQQLFDIKMKKTVSYYENRIKELGKQRKQEVQNLKNYYTKLVRLLKQNHKKEVQDLILTYNPVFSNEKIGAILDQKIDSKVFKKNTLRAYRNILQNENVMKPWEFGKIKTEIGNYSLLMDRLQNIPYKNSIPSALEHLKYLSRLTSNDYEGLWNKLADVVENKNSIISEKNKVMKQFIYALDSLTRENRENGYVLDPRNLKHIIVYINKIYKVNNGDSGYVFRRDDQFIATIVFSVKGGKITASLVKLSSGTVTLKPFDKILINLQ